MVLVFFVQVLGEEEEESRQKEKEWLPIMLLEIYREIKKT